MATLNQQTNIASAIAGIRSAENLLTQQIRAETDLLTAIKLTNEYNSLDSYLSQLLHAQNSADDLTFANATLNLKSHASGLQVDETEIKAIVSDVKTAATIVGYIVEALAFVAKL